MHVPIAAYRLMLQVAEAHRGTTPDELKLLKSYRRALGVSKIQVMEETATPVTQRMIEGTSRECEEALLAMARVAFADGRLSLEEQVHLHGVAELMGVGRVQMANLLRQAETERHKGHGHAPLRKLQYVVGGLVLLTVVIAVLNVDRLRARESSRALQAVALEADPGILLLYASYTLENGSQRKTYEHYGTGFFVSEDGYLVTCKHTVEFWKFKREQVDFLADGGHVKHRRLAAWPAGVRVGDRRSPDFEHAFTTERGTLELVATPPDRLTRSGGHVLDESDLALLKAKVPKPVHALPLAGDVDPVRSLDPVVVLGFPRGMELLETGRAVTAPSPGSVRNVESSILVSASIYPGNSGGPLLSADGEVIGVASRRREGDENLGRCVPVIHVRRLLQAAGL